MTLTGKATDLGSGISYYQFSTNGNLTASSSGWISITNTTNEITQTYTVVNNGTYYFYAKDAAGNINKKAVVISNIRYVAQIGTVKYRTLREAIAAVKTDETILMIGDTTENNTVPEDKKFTLDLGEQTITGGIVNNGEMIIKGNGCIIKNEAGNVLENNGILTVESGTYLKSSNDDEEDGRNFVNNGTATINGGTFIATVDAFTVENLGTLYFNNGIISLDYEGIGTALYNTSGTMEMTGGEVHSKTWGLCVDSGLFKSSGGIINKTGENGGAVLVRNTGSAYMYNTFSTANSSNVRNLVNNTGKYGNMIYAYTNDNESYIRTQEGLRSGVSDTITVNPERTSNYIYRYNYSSEERE